MSALLRYLAGFAAGFVVALGVSRLLEHRDRPNRLFVEYCVAFVATSFVIHWLTPNRRREWRARLPELTMAALVSALVFTWLENTWP